MASRKKDRRSRGVPLWVRQADPGLVKKADRDRRRRLLYLEAPEVVERVQARGPSRPVPGMSLPSHARLMSALRGVPVPELLRRQKMHAQVYAFSPVGSETRRMHSERALWERTELCRRKAELEAKSKERREVLMAGSGGRGPARSKPRQVDAFAEEKRRERQALRRLKC